MADSNSIIIANLAHTRFLPKKHSFSHKVYYLCVSLEKIHKLKMRLFSLNRFNIFSFYYKDHGCNNLAPLHWARDILEDWKINEANGDIILLTMPRVLGYVFNPVSFWFCMDKEKKLRAVISEVNNTFGEKHCYISYKDNRKPIEKNDWLESKKLFHVSPFFKVEGHYKFRFVFNDKQIGVWIDYYDEEQKKLTTSLIGKRVVLNGRNLLWCFVRYPFIGLKVITLIHYHAIRLICKGAKYNKKPKILNQGISR